ncbi:hypothetical protein DER29_4036 [Micromonospora sp. M71_S20]|uniref:hypothetical protein n=1 Tax=Micromonospora sp. M71_S20 TaxID=592872 RepID=UPI000EAE3A21|nr:hypothetical protein [Micromonospora sp. M71_S20]RLK26018.1 hypothetical protein DER29_4036 [Micromonospora sp. M71_S20]
MTGTGGGDGSWLRAVAGDGGRGPLLARNGQLVHGPRRLGELVQGRPPGVTGSQWSTASREGYDLVVCAADTARPVFAVEIGPVAAPGSAGQRVERLKNAVAEAVGLAVLRIGSSTLRAAEHGRRIVTYVIDARAYAALDAGEPDDTGVPPVGFRDILGRLPDGRTGHVNDLGALARAAAVEAYVARRLADPIVRGLHLRWTGGPAEGWSWVRVRPDACLVERVTVHAQRVSAGVDPGRLAEDLAAVAVGERLRAPDAAGPVLTPWDELLAEIRRLESRHGDMTGGFAFAHLCAD